MKKLFAILLCMALVMPLFFNVAAEENWDERFKQVLRKHSTVGGAVAIVKEGKVVYEYYYGRQGKKDVPVNANTKFHTASVAKMVTAIGVMQLVEQGLIDLDKDLSTYFNFPVGNPRYKSTPVTLRQVMSHTSSINGDSSFGSKKHDLEWLLTPNRSTNKQWNNYAPGTQYQYANLNGGLLGSIIECLTNISADQYMKKHVFEPLEIEAAYNVSLIKDINTVSWLFKSNGDIIESAERTYKKSGYYKDTSDYKNHYYKTVGGLYISARDLARITYILCNDGTMDGVRILNKETVELMRINQGAVPNSSVTTDKSSYGLNVDISVNDMTPVKWYGHQGVKEKFICNAYFCPELDASVVLLTNGCSKKKTNHVGNISRAVINTAYEFLTSQPAL
ncbi:MAG: serine hydrolase domain-containing protein [Eubacteriales bacterium]|nr:serine hydrolase domain-containing protein [Eubacteriales bacterium]